MYIGSYEKDSLLGFGSFGNVFKVNKDDKSYALKRIIDIDESALLEAKILKTLDHKYIIKHYETFTHDDYLCIVMECADVGTFTSHVIIHWDDGVGEEYNIWRMLQNMSEAIRYLHTNQPNAIMHCDIKPDNILVFKTESEQESGVKYCLKLTDFGVAKMFNDDDETSGQPILTRETTTCGAPIFMPPEVLKDQPFSFSVDIWSLGMIAAFMCNQGQHYFRSASDILTWQRRKSVIPYHYSMPLRNVVMDMLMIDPRDRPSAGRIVKECTDARTERGKHNDSKRDLV